MMHRHLSARRPSLQAVYVIGLAVVLLFGSAVVQAAPAASGGPVRSGVAFFEAEATNPAVGGMDEPAFRLRLAPFTATFGNDAWTLSELDYWADKYIPVADRERLIAAIADDGLELSIGSDHKAVLGIGRLSASVGVRTLGRAAVAKDLVELVFLGNELNRPYHLDSAVGVVAFGDASVAYSVNFGDRVRIGARYHQLLEAAYADAHVKAKGEFVYAEQIGVEGDVELHYTLADMDGSTGSGSALDVGANIQLTNNLSLGLAVLDLGSLHWDNVENRVCEMEVEDVGQLADDDGFPTDCTESRRSLTWNLPRRYEVSAGWQLPWGFHLGGAYTLTTHTPSDGFAFAPRNEFETMLLWSGLKFLQLGVGTVHGDMGTAITAGAGLRLGPLQTRAHISDVPTLLGNGSSKAFRVGVDFGLAFW